VWNKVKSVFGGGPRKDSAPKGSRSDALARAIDQIIDPKTGIELSKTGLLSPPTLNDGRLFLTLSVPPDDVAIYQPVRDALEVTLTSVPEVEQAFVVLSTEAPAERVVPQSSVKPTWRQRRPRGQPSGQAKRAAAQSAAYWWHRFFRHRRDHRCRVR
jgi:hypothetical protein